MWQRLRLSGVERGTMEWRREAKKKKLKKKKKKLRRVEPTTLKRKYKKGLNEKKV